MSSGTEGHSSECACRGLAPGEAAGLTRGRAEGLLAGVAVGRRAGRRAGKAESLLGVLVARGFRVSPAHQARILGCRDLPTLDRWLWRAVRAISVEEALI